MRDDAAIAQVDETVADGRGFLAMSDQNQGGAGFVAHLAKQREDGGAVGGIEISGWLISQ